MPERGGHSVIEAVLDVVGKDESRNESNGFYLAPDAGFHGRRAFGTRISALPSVFGFRVSDFLPVSSSSAHATSAETAAAHAAPAEAAATHPSSTKAA